MNEGNEHNEQNGLPSNRKIVKMVGDEVAEASGTVVVVDIKEVVAMIMGRRSYGGRSHGGSACEGRVRTGSSYNGSIKQLIEARYASVKLPDARGIQFECVESV